MDDFADQLWREFAAETEEHLQAVEHCGIVHLRQRAPALQLSPLP